MIETLIFLALIVFALVYYFKKGDTSMYKFVVDQTQIVYEKYAPYSFKEIREKVKSMGQEYSAKEYITQIAIFAGMGFGISYLYFYSIATSIIYTVVVVSVIPYLTYLRCKRIYSEFLFEQIQVYTTNTIMEFQTTQNFVKALEGVYNSGVLEPPVSDDVKYMIDLAYKNGQINESIDFMNQKYDYHMTKNMHQLFLQITREGARDSSEVLENMLIDIDVLVEGVYRDRIDRKNFHRQFVQYGLLLYAMVALVQYLLGIDNYLAILERPIVKIALHGIVLFNSYFLLNGEKYYNENVGAE
ncbi:MAG: hypothetical protein IJ568_01820 [Bacilli bacterium]|nr:hypothetical protein [Bacilli bacterium]